MAKVVETDGTNITEHDAVLPSAPDPVMFALLTPRQLRLGLLANGFSQATISAMLGAIADPTEREKALIEWEYADMFNRNNALLKSIAVALNLSDTQVDAMWRQAEKL